MVALDVAGSLEYNDQQAVIRITGDLYSPPALAGLLLSYPVIYYTEDASSRLVDSTVSVLSVGISGGQRTMMQFSCPPEFLGDVNPIIEDIIKEWGVRWSDNGDSFIIPTRKQ